MIILKKNRHHRNRSCRSLPCTLCHIYRARQKAPGIPNFHHGLVSGHHLFSCPEQLNRWPCHSLTHSVTFGFDITEWPQRLVTFQTFWWQFLMTIWPFLTNFDNFWQLRQLRQFLTILKRQSWRLVTFHWLQFWQLRTWIHSEPLVPDTGQHSQSLRCF